MDQERVWRDIVDYEGIYQISSDGFYRKRFSYGWSTPKNGRDNGKGYRQVQLCKDGETKDKYIHRLMLDHFSPNTNLLFDMVDHIDGNRSNNILSNLRWSNVILNCLNRVDKKGYTWDKKNKKWEVQIMIFRKKFHFGRYDLESEAKFLAKRLTKYVFEKLESMYKLGVDPSTKDPSTYIPTRFMLGHDPKGMKPLTHFFKKL